MASLLRSSESSLVLTLGILFQVFILTQSTSCRVEYGGSRLWKLRPVSAAQVRFLNHLDGSNNGIFIWTLDSAQHGNGTLILAAPPHLEQETLETLTKHQIAYAEYKEDRPLNRVTGGRYVFSSGPLLPLQINVRNFTYDLPSPDILAALAQPIDLIDQITVPNNSPATVTIALDESQVMTQTWLISFEEKLTITIGGSFNINLPDIGGGGLSASLTGEFSSTQTLSEELSRSYSISRSIVIPPFTTIQARGYVNWLQNIVIPFTAEGQVSLIEGEPVEGTSLTYCPEGTSIEQCYASCGQTPCPDGCVDADACICCSLALTEDNANDPIVIRDYLISKGLQSEVIGQDGNSTILGIVGTFTANTGIGVVFEVTELGGNGTTPTTTTPATTTTTPATTTTTPATTTTTPATTTTTPATTTTTEPTTTTTVPTTTTTAAIPRFGLRAYFW